MRSSARRTYQLPSPLTCLLWCSDKTVLVWQLGNGDEGTLGFPKRALRGHSHYVQASCRGCTLHMRGGGCYSLQRWFGAAAHIGQQGIMLGCHARAARAAHLSLTLTIFLALPPALTSRPRLPLRRTW